MRVLNDNNNNNGFLKFDRCVHTNIFFCVFSCGCGCGLWVRAKRKAGAANTKAQRKKFCLTSSSSSSSQKNTHSTGINKRKMASKKLAQTISKPASASEAGNIIQQTLKKVAPWKITGPASDPEWQNVPVSAEDYRFRSPASFPSENVKVPNSEPDRVFNTRYYPRDSRRAFQPVLHGRDKVKTVVSLSPTENTAGKEWDELLGNEIGKISPTDFFPGRREASQNYTQKSSGYRAVPLLENPGGGYTQ